MSQAFAPHHPRVSETDIKDRPSRGPRHLDSTYALIVSAMPRDGTGLPQVGTDCSPDSLTNVLPSTAEFLGTERGRRDNTLSVVVHGCILGDTCELVEMWTVCVLSCCCGLRS